MTNLAEMARERRKRIVKAFVAGASVETPGAKQDSAEDPTAGLFGTAGVLEPAYDPATLIVLWENSSALSQNVAAYVTNIDGLGHRLAPKFDLNADDSSEKVRDALWVARVREAELSSGAGGAPVDPIALMPTDAEVAGAIERLKVLARLERAKLKAFLDAVSPVGSFESLRRQTRQDREITGNGFWEVLRNRAGRVARFILVPSVNMRCTALDEIPTMITEKVQIGLGFEEVQQPRFFRRYVQAVGQSLVWFKEYGDPRVVSQKTGEIYTNAAEFDRKTGGKEPVATEIIHFRIPRPGEAYGAPRWIGNLLAVLGSRACDEVNFNYFDNKGIPPLALLVSGGRLSTDATEKIETYIRDNIKGRENFHRILVIEAEDDGDPLMQRELPKLKFERLTDAQQGDALFQKYDERNIDKIGSSFRIPRLLRGDVRDFNRATADASMRFADEQVFEPERLEFDGWFNRVILPEIGVTLWEFRSLGPQTRDPERVATIIVDLAKVGVVTPNEARDLASEIIGTDLDPIDEAWAKQPIQLTLAGFRPEESTPSGGSGGQFGEISGEAAARAARNQALEEAAGESALFALDQAAARFHEEENRSDA